MAFLKRGFGKLETKKIIEKELPYLCKKGNTKTLTWTNILPPNPFKCYFIVRKWPPKGCENGPQKGEPYFHSVLANLKQENFQMLNLKHRKLKNPDFAPFFEKEGNF